MSNEFSINHFPGGLVVTTVEERRIVCANQYFHTISQREVLASERIGNTFTSASKIVVESFIMPMLLHQGYCEEIQLTLETPQKERVPVLINAKILTGEQRLIYWVITTAGQRDNLYQELVNLRNDLEFRAEELEVLSQTDELSGLLNRRAFIVKAKAFIKQAYLLKQLYSFFMIDIDNFKTVNDQYGHDVGDEVIQIISHRLMSNCRGNDVLARTGGEEFAIFTLDSPHDDPKKFAEKLLAVVCAEKIRGMTITVSIGIATSNSANFEEMYKAADISLYEAKHNGRNRIVIKQV